MFTKKTIYDVDIANKRVLVRADYNVPLNEDGTIASDYRIRMNVPTIKALIEHGCKVIVCSHLGRPKGPGDKKASLAPVAKRLGELLDKPVAFAPDCIGEEVARMADALNDGDVLLLENVRYHHEEEDNDEGFAKSILEAVRPDLFVQDAFGVVHRAHATTDAITRFVQSVSGLLLAQEVDTLTRVIQEPQRPLMAIIGGAKIADKIEIIYRFIDVSDIVVIGGAMANTFLKAEGIEVGESLVDEADLPLAREILQKARVVQKQRRFVMYLPQDGVVADKIDSNTPTRIVDWDAHVIADIEAYPRQPQKAASHVGAHEKILDIGPFSGAFITGAIQMVDTVLWNGTMGVTETKGTHGPVGPFAHGSELVIEALLGQYGHKPFSIVGGGDTTSYLESRGLTDEFNHVSTGGGASLELLAGKTLPGVASLAERD